MTSLGVLLGGSELLDLLFSAFALAGWERAQIVPNDNPFLAGVFYYPLSHSLAMTVVWALAAGIVYWVLTRKRAGAVVVGLAVTSHWLLDLISHKPDLPLYPGASPMVGLGLRYSVTGTHIVELAMLAAGVGIYTRVSRPRDRVGRYGLLSFVILMLTLYFLMVLGPPAPNADAFAWVGLSFSLFLVYAAWFDHHRERSILIGR